ncbi:hypothetical protein SAMN04487866_10928 [Thermoactinomyces sp. DSM 45891]|nr:hypothetical protein SAMN05444416_112113 [Thermoactinomyces sp. DSM 45892]SFX47968.1 hypothetical protein SAMN04487866_10928 [Thermoactinomyces sp. DSM 45891]
MTNMVMYNLVREGSMYLKFFIWLGTGLLIIFCLILIIEGGSKTKYFPYSFLWGPFVISSVLAFIYHMVKSKKSGAEGDKVE